MAAALFTPYITLPRTTSSLLSGLSVSRDAQALESHDTHVRHLENHSEESEASQGSLTIGAVQGNTGQISFTSVDDLGEDSTSKGIPARSLSQLSDPLFALAGLFAISPVLSAGRKLVIALNNAGDDFPIDLTSAINSYELYSKN